MTFDSIAGLPVYIDPLLGPDTILWWKNEPQFVIAGSMDAMLRMIERSNAANFEFAAFMKSIGMEDAK